MKDEFEIEDEWLPMEIHTETPSEGVHLSKLFEEARLEKMFESLKKTGEAYGIEFKGNSILSNSHLALAGGEYAKSVGKFHEYHKKIFDYYFNKGQDIGKIDEILEISKELGMDEKELRVKLETNFYDKALESTLEKAHEYGINSTPTFIINNKYSIVGAQPLDSFRKLLNEIEKDAK